jgi:hypothetical protein
MWKYYVYNMPRNQMSSQVMHELNVIGELGWELLFYEHYMQLSNSVYQEFTRYYFKKEL